MNKIINRNWINRNIKWHQVDSNFNVDHVSDYAEISASIDHWKNILVQQANFGPGSTAVLCISHRDLRWLSLLFAIWELGGSYVMRHPDYRDVYAPFTVVVVDHKESTELETQFTNCVLSLDVWQSYVSNQAPMATQEVADNLPVIKAISVAPDLSIKLVEYSHAFSSELGKRCVGILDFTPEDHMMHMHGPLHGGGINNMLLPSLSICKNHYGVIGSFDKMPQIGNFVEQQGITKISMPNSITTERFIQHAPLFTKPVNIISMQGNQRNWIEPMKEKNIASVSSLFGNMETGGPIFVNRLCMDSADDHDCLNFGFLFDDFYQVKLTNNNQLEVKNKYQGTTLISDTFNLTDTGYVFVHRNSYMRINDIIFNVSDLDKIVESLPCSDLVYLFPDPTMNRVYLLLDCTIDDPDDIVSTINTELDKISPLIQVNYVDQQDVGLFKENNRFNEFQIRNHFRTKFKLR